VDAGAGVWLVQAAALERVNGPPPPAPAPKPVFPALESPPTLSYEVLARKHRPRRFEDVVGQRHVVDSLVNALSSGRLHHAYLFTGTRGVGKTTLARILVRALNCETGITPTPCGVCDACREIDAGRFPDLIEVDAASRTKVDETRELLDDVHYAPARGRFKVYLIDEVHMFSEKSFNALLKTLEEPPAHVKFLLATTEARKLPITVLSRCIQFTLKHLGVEPIAAHLASVLTSEGIAFEPEACRLLAEAAAGSVRDSLSLLDQAVVHGGGRVEAASVAAMLGVIERGQVVRGLERLIAGDADALLAWVAQVAEIQGGVDDFEGLLVELLRALQRIAVLQLAPAQASDDIDAALLQLAARLPPEAVQLHYQIGLQGRRDLAYAPDPRAGFEMTLLRMLAFQPEGGGGGQRTSQAPRAAPAGPRSASVGSQAPAGSPVAAATPVGEPAEHPVAPAAVEAPPRAAAPAHATAQPPAEVPSPPAARPPGEAPPRAAAPAHAAAQPPAEVPSPPAARPPAEAPPRAAAPTSAEAPPRAAAPAYAEAPPRAAAPTPAAPASGHLDWPAIADRLPLTGFTRELALNTRLAEWADDALTLRLPASFGQLVSPRAIQALAAALGPVLGESVTLSVEAVEPSALPPGESAHERRRRVQAERIAAARTRMSAHPFIQTLERLFEVSPEDIRLDDVTGARSAAPAAVGAPGAPAAVGTSAVPASPPPGSPVDPHQGAA
jgi:DNA polymerase III subunit gamma/tau